MPDKLWTPELASGGQKYPCAKCGLPPTDDGHDGCLGTLPGPIMNACCGHGSDQQAYIQYNDGTARIGGVAAVAEQKRLIAECHNGQ